MTPLLSKPTVARLCALHAVCDQLVEDKVEKVSSSILGGLIGCGANSLRRDLFSAGISGEAGSGYDPAAVRDQLHAFLGMSTPRRTCVVGLGRLGAALLAFDRFGQDEFEMVAGFDSNINRLETLRTSIKTYPDHEIAEVVAREQIEIALLAVPATAAIDTARTLVSGGVKGILNFAPVSIESAVPGVIVRNMDMVNELRVIGYLLKQSL